MTAALAYRDVSVRLGGRSVVQGLSLDVQPGSVTALVGPNGAGKTTALRAGCGLQPVASGEVRLDGLPLPGLKPRVIARTLAFVAQDPVLPPLFTVRAIVALGRTPYLGLLANESARDWEIVEEAMRVTGVERFDERPVGQLSGGERQRVVLARSLAQQPRVLLLDEPIANLDLRYQASILNLVRDLAHSTGLACLVVLHDLTLAAEFSDHVMLLAEGRPQVSGRPGDVLLAERLASVYATPLHSLEHPDRGTPVIVHADRRLL